MTTPLIESPHFSISDEPDVLAEINQRDTSIAIWRRQPNQQIAAWLASIVEMKVCFRIDLRVNPLDAASFLSIHPQIGSLAPASAKRAWVSDIGALVLTYARIANLREVRVRVTTVDDHGCGAFHVDTLSLRLLCTYHGHGTQWLEDENVRRNQLGLNGRSIPDANRAIVIDPSRIRTSSGVSSSSRRPTNHHSSRPPSNLRSSRPPSNLR